MHSMTRLLLALCPAVGCCVLPSPLSAQSEEARLRAGLQSQFKIDSAQAVRADLDTASALDGRLSMRVFSVHADLEGYLIRVLPTDLNTRGGGALIWIFGDTGQCVILRHYH